MSFQKEARTAFASRALVVGEMFNLKFRGRRLAGNIVRIPRIEPPDTESTGGGKMARETIALVPEGEGARESTIVVGWIDLGDSTAELRSHTVLLNRHQARFGDLPFDIRADEYGAFLTDAQAFLAEEGITTTLLDEERAPLPEVGSAPPPPAAKRPTRNLPVAAAGTSASGVGVGTIFLAAFGGMMLGGAVIGAIVYFLLRAPA